MESRTQKFQFVEMDKILGGPVISGVALMSKPQLKPVPIHAHSVIKFNLLVFFG